jgi:hypothetical protein
MRMGHEHGRHSWNFLPYDTCQRNRSGQPGSSTSRHLPPPGFDYPLDDLLPARPPPAAYASDHGLRLMTVRRPPSILGVPPSGSCSSRPAAPLSGPRLSCHFPDPRERDSAVAPEVYPYPRFVAESTEVDSPVFASGKGNDQPKQPCVRLIRRNGQADANARSPNLTLVGLRPSKAFSSITLRSDQPILGNWPSCRTALTA